MKIRLERDVLAEAVQWAARSLPLRPSVPILAGLLVQRRRRRCHVLQFRLRDVGSDPCHGGGRRRGSGAGLWSAARRHLPESAAEAGRYHLR